MEFFQRAPARGERLGILPGTFNPVTIAHVSLARAALRHVDEVVFVLPRVFPHKTYSGASFNDRVEMLRAALAGEEAFSIATSDGGLFIDIARECREAYGEDVRLSFLCGRDAAERIVGWDYGRADAVAEMLRDFDLLVAGRNGQFEAPGELAAAVRCLELDDSDGVSATEVRDRIARGEHWEHLVPARVVDRVRRVYAP
jgi:nicotinate-nucleotide adenylyltransferase